MPVPGEVCEVSNIAVGDLVHLSSEGHFTPCVPAGSMNSPQLSVLKDKVLGTSHKEVREVRVGRERGGKEEGRRRRKECVEWGVSRGRERRGRGTGREGAWRRAGRIGWQRSSTQVMWLLVLPVQKDDPYGERNQSWVFCKLFYLLFSFFFISAKFKIILC